MIQNGWNIQKIVLKKSCKSPSRSYNIYLTNQVNNMIFFNVTALKITP